MEIGISMKQLVEIGLNMAGFVSAALLLMIIQSLFRRPRPKKIVVNNSTIDMSPKSDETVQPSKPLTMKAEFIDLSGSVWHPRRPSLPSDGSRTDARRRQNVIKLARAMLQENRDKTAANPTPDRQTVQSAPLTAMTDEPSGRK